MRKTILAAALVLAFGGAQAHAGNLVLNGSFENGLTGWTIGGTDGPGQGSGYPPVAIYYGAAQPYPAGAFGEAIPQNNAPTNSPDAVGARAAYFVSDFATDQSLSQLVTVVNAGIYEVGFSAYAPANGFANKFDATFSGVVGRVPLFNYSVKGGQVTLWQTFAFSTHLGAGNHLVEFVFNTRGYPAADVVIDQVYVRAVPTPDGGSTALLLATGLAGLAGVAQRLRRRD